MAKSDPLKDLCEKYNLHNDDTFKSPQGWTIIKRRGIDKIQAIANIDINYDIVEYTPAESAAIKATSKWNSRILTTFGESNTKNCRQSYVLAMAEKRAMSRIVLKLTGFYELGVMSEDESEDFKEDKSKDLNSNNNTTDSNSNYNELPKDRFDKAIKNYQNNPDGVIKELKKWKLSDDQLKTLRLNNVKL
jgi:hypothetical protein